MKLNVQSEMNDIGRMYVYEYWRYRKKKRSEKKAQKLINGMKTSKDLNEN